MFGEANQPGGYIMGDIDDDSNAGASYIHTLYATVSLVLIAGALCQQYEP